MKYLPLLMMRTRGLSGPLFAKHKGCKKLSKSVGVSESIRNNIKSDLEITSDAGTTLTSDLLVSLVT